MATLNILYEDPHILVCVKPHGIATQSKSIRYPDMVSLIKNHLAKASGTSGKSGAPKSIGSRTPGSAEPYLAVIHRLDQPVAGILVFAKTPAAAKDLNKQLQNQGFGKYYRALVTNAPSEKEGTLEDIWSKMPGRTLPESVLQRKTERRLHGCIMIRFLTMAGCFQLFPAALPLLMSLCLRKVRNVTRPNLRFIWTPDVITRSVCSLPPLDARSSEIQNITRSLPAIKDGRQSDCVLISSISNIRSHTRRCIFN